MRDNPESTTYKKQSLKGLFNQDKVYIREGLSHCPESRSESSHNVQYPLSANVGHASYEES